MRPPARPLVAAVLLVLALVPAPATPAEGAGEAVQAGEAEAEGLRVAWRYAALANPAGAGIGTLEVAVSDAATGAPLHYNRGQLVAWIQRRRPAVPGAGESGPGCADTVRLLASQGIGRRAEIDLNTWRLLTLNTDGTLAVINPFVGLNNAKLESIIDLGGAPRAWRLIPERLEAWMVLAGPPRLVAVDLHARRIARAIDLPGDGPAAAAIGREWPGTVAPVLAFEPVAQRLWLGLPGQAGLGVLAPGQPEEPLRLLPGPPPIGLFADAGGRLPGIVSLHADGAVALWQGETVRRRWRLPGAAAPVGIGYSGLLRRLLLATDTGDLAWIDPEAADGTPPERVLTLGHPVRVLALYDGERRAMALGGGRASLVDLATGRLEHALETAPGAEEVTFTERFAYALSPHEGRATLWPLAELREGRAEAVELTLGRARPPPAEASPQVPPGPALAVPTPPGNGLLVASPTDGVVYQYAEGLMAPIGSYSNYRRAAFGLQLLDLSLRAVAPGRYTGPVQHARGGLYELVLGGAGPRFAVCAPLQLAPVAGSPAPEAAPRAELAGMTPATAGRRTIRIRLREAGSAATAVAAVPDLVLLLFDRRSGWQARIPLREEGTPGEYVARPALPGDAPLEAMVASASRNLSFIEGRVGVIPVEPRP